MAPGGYRVLRIDVSTHRRAVAARRAVLRRFIGAAARRALIQDEWGRPRSDRCQTRVNSGSDQGQTGEPEGQTQGQTRVRPRSANSLTPLILRSVARRERTNTSQNLPSSARAATGASRFAATALCDCGQAVRAMRANRRGAASCRPSSSTTDPCGRVGRDPRRDRSQAEQRSGELVPIIDRLDGPAAKRSPVPTSRTTDAMRTRRERRRVGARHQGDSRARETLCRGARSELPRLEELSKRSFGQATAKYRELGTASNLLPSRIGRCPRGTSSRKFEGAADIAHEQPRHRTTAVPAAALPHRGRTHRLGATGLPCGSNTKAGLHLVAVRCERRRAACAPQAVRRGGSRHRSPGHHRVRHGVRGTRLPG